MSKSETSGLPVFFNYKEEGTDGGYESIQDFFLSWAIRCADDKYKEQNPRIHEFGKQMVFLLLFGDNKNDDDYTLDKQMSTDFRITNVKTRRQFRKIDLIAEIDLEENSVPKKYILNIENKWYSSIRVGQLEYSKEVINNEYGLKGIDVINLVIFCDEEIIARDPSQKQKCKANGYKCLSFGDIKEITKLNEKGRTNNALFDEYWFNF